MTNTQVWLSAIGIVVAVLVAAWQLQKDKDAVDTARRLLEIEEARHLRESAQWDAEASQRADDRQTEPEAPERMKTVPEVLNAIEAERMSAEPRSGRGRQVTATGKDSDGDITKLCGAFGSRNKLGAISDIENGVRVYMVGDSVVEVVKQAEGKYLRTRPSTDGSPGLDDLPHC